MPPGGHPNSFIAGGESPSHIDRQGRLLLLNYPATETTIGAPYYAISRFYDRVDHKPLLRRAMNRRGYSDIGQSWSYIYGRTGLSFYPAAEGSGAYYLPFPGGGRPAAPIGFSLFHHAQGTPAFTLSCAACHTRNLFGRPVLGASNIHGGVGSSLLLLKKFSSLRPREFRFASRPTGAETRTFHDMQVKASYIHGTQPLAMGLENPASVVGLSLAGRAPDSQATRDPRFAGGAYRSPLWSIPADTKPAPWWTLRYKNRFLLDGSMKGDPILGQFIFNEIGRGADLAHLQSWIERNREEFRAMNGAILAMERAAVDRFFPRRVGEPGSRQTGRADLQPAVCRLPRPLRKGLEWAAGRRAIPQRATGNHPGRAAGPNAGGRCRHRPESGPDHAAPGAAAQSAGYLPQ